MFWISIQIAFKPMILISIKIVFKPMPHQRRWIGIVFFENNEFSDPVQYEYQEANE